MATAIKSKITITKELGWTEWYNFTAKDNNIAAMHEFKVEGIDIKTPFTGSIASIHFSDLLWREKNLGVVNKFTEVDFVIKYSEGIHSRKLGLLRGEQKVFFPKTKEESLNLIEELKKTTPSNFLN